MITFDKFLYKCNCILLESSASKQMETHLSHLEDLAIERGKQGFKEFIETVDLFLKKIIGQESDLEINAKIDGSPALLFGKDPREKYLNQFFISLKHSFDPSKGVIREDSKVMHSPKDIHTFYGERPEFAKKLNTLLSELNRAYDNSGNVYQCDVLFAGKEDKTIQRIDGEDYLIFKPNVLVYAIPVDYESAIFNRVNESDVGIVVHDSFTAQRQNNEIKLRQKARRVDSILKSGQRAGVFILGSNFTQAKVEVDDKTILKINNLIGECTQLLPSISDDFDSFYVGSQVMEYLKIYINKQIDLPDGGIFSKTLSEDYLNKFLHGFKKFIENRFKVIIDKRKTEKGRVGQKEKLKSLLDFLTSNQDNLIVLLSMFSKMIEIKRILLGITENLTDDLKKTFFEGQDGTFISTKGEGHVLFNRGTHVKIVDRLEFTKINRQKGGQR